MNPSGAAALSTGAGAINIGRGNINNAAGSATMNPRGGGINIGGGQSPYNVAGYGKMQNTLSPGAGSVLNSGNAALNSADQNIQSSQALEQQIQQLLQADAPGTANTSLNLNAIRAAAQRQAQKQVNPLYTQQLNQYLQNEAANQKTEQAKNQLQLQGYQQALGNTLAQNTQAEKYASQQNAMDQANINAQAANYQLNSGDAQNAKIAALQSSEGQGGLGGSGLGQQQIWQAENAKNVADAQQQGQFQYNRNVANLTANNTFANLAQSSDFAKSSEANQEQLSNLSLSSWIRQMQYEEQQARQATASGEQNAINAYTQNNEAAAITNSIRNMGLSNKDLQATQQYYAPELNYASTPQLTSLQSYVV